MYSDTRPKLNDSDNNLLFKIAQVLNGQGLSGSGLPTAASVEVIGQPDVAVVEQPGAANIAASQSATSGAAAIVLASRATRRSVTVKNIDTSITIYIGHDATVSSTTGMQLLAGQSISVDSTAAIWGISVSGTPRLAFLESYD